MTELDTVKGLIRQESRHPAPVTIHRLETLLAEKGVKIFARIDFSADAQAAGMQLPPELMLIFGNPKGGTPLMLERPTVGIDLPLKALAFNDPDYIIERHGLSETLAKNLAVVIPLIEQACRP